MGKRGPAPLPLELHAQRGTLRPDRHGDGRGAFVIGGKPADAPAPPAYFTAEEREVFEAIADVLHGAGLLDLADVLALEAMAVVVARARAADRELRAEGASLVVKGDRGSVQNPLVKISRDAWAEARSWFGKFGMTASDRVGLAVGGLEGLTLRAALERALAGAHDPGAPAPGQLELGDALELEAGEACETRRRDGAACERELGHAGRHRYGARA